ncbi:MAG: Rpn family recombination-promoting nuclease/putative transposase, partial [Leptospiraceae bacterium]|nr:Rpn family recombination-promoting nuclease/putative transposase [Leptospiraceae bacterium]
ILNPEIPKNKKKEKLSILDIKAEDILGDIFYIEMQAYSEKDFAKRTLFYWSKLFSSTIEKGEEYEKIPKVYSFNFVNFNFLENTDHYHSVFKLKEISNPEIQLTDALEIHIIELRKFRSNLSGLNNTLEEWLYTIKQISTLEEEQMKSLQKKSPKIKKAINAVKFVSLDENSREYYEYHLKAELDYNSGINGAFRSGKEEGIKEGIEKGIAKGETLAKEKTAISMLKKKLDIKLIQEITGISIKQLKELQKKVNTKPKKKVNL